MGRQFDTFCFIFMCCVLVVVLHFSLRLYDFLLFDDGMYIYVRGEEEAGEDEMHLLCLYPFFSAAHCAVCL